MHNYIITSEAIDPLGHYIGVRNYTGMRNHEEKEAITSVDRGFPFSEVHVLRFAERERLDGTYAEGIKYFEQDLPVLRRRVEAIVSFDQAMHNIIEVGNSLTALFAAYYAVLCSKAVTVNLHTPPAFGGDTLYAKTHPHLTQKLVYNILLKAAVVTGPSDDALEAIAEVYPRIGEPHFKVSMASIPDQFIPTTESSRKGIAVFAEFAPNGGIDQTIEALMRIIQIHPQIAQAPISILGAGDHKQASNIAVAFPHWQVSLNPPVSKYVQAASEAEVVIMPDAPPHAGLTKELLAAIGAGAAIVAHDNSAAGVYAGRGAVLFGNDDGNGNGTKLPTAILRAVSDPAVTWAMMARTKAHCDEMKKQNPDLSRLHDLGFPVEVEA